MHVGVARLTLHIPGARSLKDRRQVVHSLKEKLRSRFPISIAEIGDADRHQHAALGVAIVSGDSGVCQSVLSKVIHFAQGAAEALLSDVATEIVSFGGEGQGVRGGPARGEWPGGWRAADDESASEPSDSADEGEDGEHG